MLTALEWLGCALGIIGAWLLATNASETRSKSVRLWEWSITLPIPAAKYGWVFFAASNAAWIAFGLLSGLWGLVTQQVFFTGTSVLGIRNWILRDPARQARTRGGMSIKAWVRRITGVGGAWNAATTRRQKQKITDWAIEDGRSIFEYDVCDLPSGGHQ